MGRECRGKGRSRDRECRRSSAGTVQYQWRSSAADVVVVGEVQEKCGSEHQERGGSVVPPG